MEKINMAGIFYTPSMPKLEVTPAQNTNVIDESKTRAKTLEALRKKKGRAANMLAGDYYGANSQAAAQSNSISGQPLASKTLLGQ